MDAPRLPPDWGAALRDSVFSALITFGLCLPLVLYRLDTGPGASLVLVPRFGLVVVLVAIVFAVRLLRHLVERPTVGSLGRKTSRPARPSQAGINWSEGGLRVFIGVALAFPFVTYLLEGSLSQTRYWVDLGILILTYVMLGWGLNIVVGLAGLLDLGYVAFYAVGAYAYALLATTLGLSFWLCLPLAGLLAAFCGILLGFPILRLRGDYLAIVTLAFGEIIRLLLINWEGFSGGAAGIAEIPRITFFGIPFTEGPEGFAALFSLTFNPMHRIFFLYYLILALALATALVTIRLRRLPVGRAWEALREDEVACRSLGINTTNTKLTAFAVGAMFGGFAGAFFAVRQGFVSPESFTFMESAIILAIVVLGGMGSQIGVAFAALVMVGGPELLRHAEVATAMLGDDFDPGQYRLLVFGAGMVAMMILRPRGLVSEREPTVFLKERRTITASLVKEGNA